MEVKMDKDQLIVRLTLELYESKQKLEKIYILAEEALFKIPFEANFNRSGGRSELIDIINLIDTSDIRED